MKFGLAGLAAAALLLAAPLSLAQQATAPASPPAATRPAPVPPTTAPTPPSATTPATPPAAGAPTAPAAPTSPAPPAMTPAPTGEGDASNDPARTCRTFRDVSQQCSCRSAPTEMGTAVAPTDGGTRNLCVVPRQ